jgi:uncharacterized protein
MAEIPHYPPPPMNFAVTAAAFEGGLAIFALSLGWAFSLAPMDSYHWSWADLGWGGVATLPPLAILGLCLYLPWEPFRRILRILARTILPLFRQCGLFEIAVIAFLAGLGEEMLFRSIVQKGLADWIGTHYGPAIGLATATLVFGMLHGITLTYAVIAGIIGLYLGLIWLYTGNLLVPITAHALYDFLAILIMRTTIKPKEEKGESINDE